MTNNSGQLYFAEPNIGQFILQNRFDTINDLFLTENYIVILSHKQNNNSELYIINGNNQMIEMINMSDITDSEYLVTFEHQGKLYVIILEYS